MLKCPNHEDAQDEQEDEENDESDGAGGLAGHFWVMVEILCCSVKCARSFDGLWFRVSKGGRLR
jgi:hypothetical protein